ncbi:hypothetical protein NDI56_14325 [Haloarcula sp. S1CR25-12]|uniref:Uncharacterized protein n=1 Tax=Haloarcula saliterrae TaxID=2950534 RepID=A0ABU2FEB2_9EURY|nr:hypothetical protein [Haloarcula sp. S1CR25-12]MDS0260579.1 hypothetical protein [Haloarcula sp. S1CR25-12]
MLLSQTITAVVLAFLAIGPAIYYLVPLGPTGATPSYERAVAIALAGFAIGGLGTFLLGWIPLLGRLVAPASWVGVLLLLDDIDKPTAAGVGLVSWLISAVAFAITGMLV